MLIADITAEVPVFEVWANAISAILRPSKPYAMRRVVLRLRWMPRAFRFAWATSKEVLSVT